MSYNDKLKLKGNKFKVLLIKVVKNLIIIVFVERKK